MALSQLFEYSTSNWTFPAFGAFWGSKTTTVTTTDLQTALITKTIYNYTASGFGTNDPIEGAAQGQMPIERSIQYQNGDGTTLRTVKKTWLDPQLLSSEQTVLENGVSSQVNYAYKDSSAYAGGILTEKDEYDFGLSLARKTVIHYQDFGVTPIYLDGPSILDRPCQTVVSDGAGNSVSEVDYFYDNGSALCGASGTPSVTGVSNLPSGTHDEDHYAAGSISPRGNVTKITRKCFLPSTGASCPDSSTQYSYDSTGQVLSETDARNNVTNYSYADGYSAGTPSGNTNAYLTQITRPQTGTVKHLSSFTYAYADGQVTGATGENGQLTSYTYDDPLRRLTETDFPDQGQIKLSYNDSGPSPSIVTTQRIDLGKNLVSTAVFYGMGHSVQTQLNSDPEGVVFTDTAYDGLCRPITVSNPHRASVSPTDGVTTNSYDALGRVVTVKRPDGNVVQTEYVGNQLTVTDEAGKKRRTFSDGLSRLIQVDEPIKTSQGTSATGDVNVSGSLQSLRLHGTPATSAAGTIDIGGQEQAVVDTTACEYVNGKPTDCPTVWDNGTLSITVNGFTASFGYGKLSTLAGLASGLANAFNADGASPVSASSSGSTVFLTAKAGGAFTNYAFAASCVTLRPNLFSSPSFGTFASGSTLAGGNDAIPGPTVFDSGSAWLAVGTFTATVNYGAGANDSSAVAGALAQVFNWDSNSPVTAGVSGSGVTLTSKIPGEIGNVSVTGGSSTAQPQYFSSPSFNVSFSGMSGGSDGSPFGTSAITRYSYDALDNLTRVEQWGTSGSCDANCLVRTFEYDSLSRLLKATNPETGKIQYGYDANGNVVSRTDNKGTVVTNSYDALNRLTGKSFSDGKAPYLFSYDQSTFRGVSLSNTIGRLSSNSNNVNAGGASSYDAMGRVIYQTNCVPSNCGDNPNGVTAAYNLAGGLTSLTYPSGRHITNSYNAGDRLAGVTLTDFAGTATNYLYVTAVSYAPSGAMKALTYGNGVVDAVDFNSRLQPLNMLVSADTQTFSHKTYNRSLNGNNGNVLGIGDALNSSRNQSFGYDTLNRLTSAQADSFNQTYSYDAFGNLTQHGSPIDTSGFSINPSNQMIGGGIAYDANGNMTTTNQGQILAYNAENQIVSVVGADNRSVANYTYGPEGERVRKDLPAGAFTEYMYFGGNVIGEKNQAGDWSDYIYANGRRVAKADSSKNEVQIKGTDTAVWQYTWWKLVEAPTVAVGAGDKLYFMQYQQGAAEGGVALLFQDGSNSADAVKDQDGSYANLDLVLNKWHSRVVDLSPYAGKSIVGFYVGNDTHGPVGSWEIRYADIVLVRADGTVSPIYTGQPTVTLEYVSVNTPGVTGLVDTVTREGNLDVQTTLAAQFYHQDSLGTSRLMTSSGGWPVWQGTFSPFGQEINREATTNHYKFTGKERDAESGLDYFGARHYSSSIGRWMSPDKPFADQHASNPQSWNLYEYARNNPLRNLDPNGFKVLPAVLAEAVSKINSLPGGTLYVDFAGIQGLHSHPSLNSSENFDRWHTGHRDSNSVIIPNNGIVSGFFRAFFGLANKDQVDTGKAIVAAAKASGQDVAFDTYSNGVNAAGKVAQGMSAGDLQSATVVGPNANSPDAVQAMDDADGDTTLIFVSGNDPALALGLFGSQSVSDWASQFHGRVFDPGQFSHNLNRYNDAIGLSYAIQDGMRRLCGLGNPAACN